LPFFSGDAKDRLKTFNMIEIRRNPSTGWNTALLTASPLSVKRDFNAHEALATGADDVFRIPKVYFTRPSHINM
jgi:hypothetical protein